MDGTHVFSLYIPLRSLRSLRLIFFVILIKKTPTRAFNYL